MKTATEYSASLEERMFYIDSHTYILQYAQKMLSTEEQHCQGIFVLVN